MTPEEKDAIRKRIKQAFTSGFAGHDLRIELGHDAEALLAEVERLDWISVVERLPESGIVLTWGPLGPCVSYLTEAGWCRAGSLRAETVTHWMPLPEPPKR